MKKNRKHPRFSRLQRRAMAGIVAAGTALAVLIGIAAPAQAATTQSSGIMYHNGYYIENFTDQTLTLKNTSQPGGTDPDNPNVHFSEGFSVSPPKTIAPGKTAYFEINVYEYQGYTSDQTTLTYATPDGKTMGFDANVKFHWILGVRYFDKDLSYCTGAYGCSTHPSTGSGTQTIFSAYMKK